VQRYQQHPPSGQQPPSGQEAVSFAASLHKAREGFDEALAAYTDQVSGWTAQTRAWLLGEAEHEPVMQVLGQRYEEVLGRYQELDPVDAGRHRAGIGAVLAAAGQAVEVYRDIVSTGREDADRSVLWQHAAATAEAQAWVLLAPQLERVDEDLDPFVTANRGVVLFGGSEVKPLPFVLAENNVTTDALTYRAFVDQTLGTNPHGEAALEHLQAINEKADRFHDSMRAYTDAVSGRLEEVHRELSAVGFVRRQR
jgi:hypothetical protein